MRIRPGSTTEKCPDQSSRDIRTSAMILPTPAGPSAGKRNSKIPQLAGNPERHASSPKSLSKVRSTRASSRPRASTSSSVIPGASVRIQTTSCPNVRSAVTASPGKFSSARNRIVCNTGVVPQNVGFSPALTQQAHYEIHSQPAATDHRLSCQHRRIKGYPVSPVHFMSLSAIKPESVEPKSWTTANELNWILVGSG
jgi:hypothetical protein